MGIDIFVGAGWAFVCILCAYLLVSRRKMGRWSIVLNAFGLLLGITTMTLWLLGHKCAAIIASLLFIGFSLYVGKMVRSQQPNR